MKLRLRSAAIAFGRLWPLLRSRAVPLPSIWRRAIALERARYPSPSPKLGEGWGGGCSLQRKARRAEPPSPPPYPSPASGEGTAASASSAICDGPAPHWEKEAAWRYGKTSDCSWLWLRSVGRGAVVADRVLPPPLERLESVSTLVLDRDARVLRAYTTADGAWRLPADLAQIDPTFVRFLLAYEDQRFRAHPGVDVLAAGRATWQAVRHGRIVSGASTLTMQLARLMEPSRRTLGAKLAEMGRALADRAAAEQGRYPRRLSHLRALWRQPRRRACRQPRLFRQGAAAPDGRRGGVAGRLAAGAGDGAARSVPASGQERAGQGAAPDAGARLDRCARARDGAERAGARDAPGVSLERAASRGPADPRTSGRAPDPDVDRRRPAARLAGDRAALPVPPRAERDHRDPRGGEQESPGARLCRLQRLLRQPPLRAERHGDGDPLAGLCAQALHLRHGVRRAGGAPGDHDAGRRAALRRLCAEELRWPFPRPDQRARGAAGLAQHPGGRLARPGRPAALRAAAVGIRRAARVPDRGEAARPAGRARRRGDQPGRAGDALRRSRRPRQRRAAELRRGNTRKRLRSTP